MDMNGDGMPDTPSGHDAYGHADFTGPGQATYDAIGIAHSHETGQSHISLGSVSGGAHFEGHHSHELSSAGPDQISQRIKSTEDRRFFEAHVTAHGAIDVMAAFAQIAQTYDVIRIDPTRPALDAYKERIEELSDSQPWTPPYHVEKDPPEGFYPGATGSTNLEIQIWQVGIRADTWDSFFAWVLDGLGWKRLKSAPVYDSKARTYFVVRCATLEYDQTKDFETYFSIFIKSQLIWHRYFGEYANLKIPLERHRKAAEKMIHEVLEVLKKAEPSEFSRNKRLELSARQPVLESPTVNSSQHVFPQTLEEESPNVTASGSEHAGDTTAGKSSVDPNQPKLQKVDITVTIPRS